MEKILENPDFIVPRNESTNETEISEFQKPNIQRPILEREWDKPKLSIHLNLNNKIELLKINIYRGKNLDPTCR